MQRSSSTLSSEDSSEKKPTTLFFQGDAQASLSQLIDIFDNYITQLEAENQETREKNASFFTLFRDVVFSKAHLQIREKLVEELKKYKEQYRFDRKMGFTYMCAELANAIRASTQLHIDALIHHKNTVTESKGKYIACKGYTPLIQEAELSNLLLTEAAGVDKHLSMTRMYYSIINSSYYKILKSSDRSAGLESQGNRFIGNPEL